MPKLLEFYQKVQTDKIINSLNQYDKAKEKLPEGLTEDKKASLTGIQEKIDKLEESKKKLAPQYHDRVDNTINSLKDRAIKILESKDPLAEEVDNTLGVKGSEEIAGEPAFSTEVEVTEEVKPTEENRFYSEDEMLKYEKDIQKKLDDYQDNVEKKYLENGNPTNESFKKMNDELNDVQKHKEYWDLIDKRDEFQYHNEKVLQRIANDTLSGFGEISEELKDNLIKNYFKINPDNKLITQLASSKEGYNSLLNNLNNESLPRLAEVIARGRLKERGLDFDGVFSQISGWSESQKQEFLKENAVIAKKIQSEIFNNIENAYKKPSKEAKPTEAKPVEQKVTVELLSSEEPPQKEGETIVTLSGKTEKERVESIDRRKRETKVSDKVVAENDLIQDAEAYFKKDGRYKNSAEGRNELNNLRIKARDLGLEIDTDRDAVTRRGKSGRPTKVRYNNKADGESVVDPNGRTLTQRGREVQDAFEELTDAGIFLDVQTELGKRMSASQIDAAIKDILDGIPSKRAETYLNALEKAIAEDAFPLYDKALGDIAPRLDEIRAQLGIEREVIGEPMDEAALNKFLGEEAELTPEEEQILLDNVENLLYEYETTEEGPQGEVQPIEARAEEGVSGKAEPVAEAKEAGEAPKSVKEVYDEFSSKKSELAKKKIINDNFDTIVEDLIKNKKIERIC